jgi:DNA-binding NarL/FixJ family response regulator
MRVLVADDLTNVRSALILLLAEQPGLQVVGEAADTFGLLLTAESQNPDVILLDWELRGMPTSKVVHLLHHILPQVCIVALSGRPEARQEALTAGVHAFVSKGAAPEHLIATLHNLEKREQHKHA